MKRYISLAVALTAFAGLLTFAHIASAGRLGGPMSQEFVVAPFDSVHTDVVMQADRTGVISVVGNGITPLNVCVTDGDGHLFEGVGHANNKTVTLNVYRTGEFRITVQNMGPYPNNVYISTN